MSPFEDLVSYINLELPKVSGVIDQNNLAPQELIDGLRSRGAFNALNLGLNNVYALVRASARWSPAVAHIIMTSASVAFRINRDGPLYSLCITEPGGGSDIKSNLKTVADERTSGEAYLTGEKIYASNSLYADEFLVLANGPQGPTLYLAKGGPGIKVEAQDLFTFRGAGVGRVVFEGVPAQRVGTPGKGIREALETVNFERLSYGFIGLGIAEGALEETGPQALTKKIFGQELGSFQGVKWMMADLLIDMRLLEEFVASAVSKAEREGKVDPLDAAIAKATGAQLAQRATWVAMQIMGGRGFTRGSRLERLARDARMLDIGGGAREVVYDFIGEQAVNRFKNATR